MSFKRLYYKTFCVMEWNIGLAKGDIGEIIRNKSNNLSFKWLPLNKVNKSIADPFLFRTKNGQLNLIYEYFSMVDLKQYGKIAISVLDENFEIISNKEILDSGTHTSYPFVFNENGETYIIPESRQKGKVFCYKYDEEDRTLNDAPKIIKNLPLLDSTIIKYQNKYWLFATLGDGKFDQSKLYIYYSDSLLGPYTAHRNNPVKSGLNGTRPAGDFIEFKGEIYRPAQNCKNYYGESITINRIVKLTEEEFEEEYYFEITADKMSNYSSGIHTINVLDDIIVVDGIKMVFSPLSKFKNFLKKKFK